MENQEQKHIFTTPEGEKVFGTKEPEDAKERLKKAEDRDFATAEAIKRGASFKEIMEIQKKSGEKNKENS